MMGDDITLGPLCCPSITSCLTKVGLPLSSQTAQRLGGSQVVQSLTTPVVSVATPSLLAPFSGMQTAYNTGKTPRRASRDVLSVEWKDLKSSPSFMNIHFVHCAR